MKVAVAGAGFLSPILPWPCPLPQCLTPPRNLPLKELTLDREGGKPKWQGGRRPDMEWPRNDINITRGACKGEWV